MSERKGKAKPISPDKWNWFGNAGHFICAEFCRFHMCTQVGDYLVSTVGEHFPDAEVREIIANSRGIQLEGKGDRRRCDYMIKVGFETMGATPHKYETLVFKAGKPCKKKECGECGLPFPSDYSEIDGSRWMTAGEATRGHMKFCRKYASGRPKP